MPSRVPSKYRKYKTQSKETKICNMCGVAFKDNDLIIRREKARSYHVECYYVVGLYFPEIPWVWLFTGEGADLDLNLLIGSCFGEAHNLIAKEEAG